MGLATNLARLILGNGEKLVAVYNRILTKLHAKRSMHIVQYPHLTLRHKSKPLKKVDATLKKQIAEMFDLMYEAKGIGLAANQVDLPLQFFIVNTTGMKGEGEELVFINPVLSKPKFSEEAEEGCLSMPGIYGNVVRPKQIKVTAYGLDGKEIEATVDGLLSRVIQHEFDHIQGVLFTDRMTDSGKLRIDGLLEEFELAFQSQQNVGGIPSDEEIRNRLAEIEKNYA